MLTFKKIEATDLELIKKYMKQQAFGSCDFTVFGIFLWADHYNYAYCVFDETFYLMGKTENGKTDFAVPFGKIATETAIDNIREYCLQKNLTPRFYFVPETAIASFKGPTITQMEGWSDYVYSSDDLKTLKGHRFNKKRNRLNKFVKNCESCHGEKCCRFEPITSENIEEAKRFFEVYLSQYAKEDDHFESESILIRKALDIFFDLDQTGGLLYIKDTVVAMTIGEKIGDTLYVHVEKALREYDGAYEAINYAYANENATEEIKFINREEDMGDEGLRQAKMAYNPIKMIHKYEVFLAP